MTYCKTAGLLLMAGLSVSCVQTRPTPVPDPIPMPVTTEKTPTLAKTPEVTSAADTATTVATSGVDANDTAAPFIEYRYFPSAKAALLDIIATTRPQVIGFGEYHSQTGDHVTSALSHFTTELLPVLAPVTSDIVVEALVNEGGCKALGEQVTTDVKADTKRPEETVDEVSVLFEKARASGVTPHFITMTCRDNESIYGENEVDYDKMLKLIGAKLFEKTIDVMSARASKYHRKSKPLIAIYGGAIHNDVHPREGSRAYSFGQRMTKRLPNGKYVEIDLIVPEVAKDVPYVQDASWYPLFRDKVSPEKTLLIKQSDTEFLLVFPGKS